MIHHLLRRTPPLKTLTLTLIHPFSTSNHHRRRHPKPQQPPQIPQSSITSLLSQLPSRFTPSDLTSLLSSIPSSNPLLIFHLFTAASHLPRFQPHPSPFLFTIKALGSAKLYSELNSIATLALSTLPPSLPLFNTLIYFFAESRSLSKAVYVYNRLRDSPEPETKPNLQTYNLLFNALLGRGSNSYIHHVYMDTIRSLFRQMVNSGVQPDVITMNFVVRGYVNSMHLNDALRVFHQFEMYGVVANANTYNYLVHGLCAQGRTRNAMEMYGEMRGKGMEVGRRAGNSMVSALAMGGEVEEAVGVMWEVVGRGRGMDEITVRTVVEGVLRKGGGKEEVVGLATEMREREVVDGRVYRELLNGIEDWFGGGDDNDGGIDGVRNGR